MKASSYSAIQFRRRHATNPTVRLPFLVIPVLAAGLLSRAQVKTESEAVVQPKEEVLQLMTYKVNAKDGSGYYSPNSISGTRLATPLNELPMTVNVVTNEQIIDMGAVKLEEMVQYTPGVQKGQDFEGRFTIRGYLDAFPRLNGVQTTGSSRWDSAIVERIEVVKGSSAALYGSTAGAGGFVNIITKKPLFKEQGEVSFSASSYDRFRTTVDVTGPMASSGRGATLAYRFIGVAQEGSNLGWRDFADGSRTVLSPSFTWRPSERTEVTFEFYHDRYNRVMDIFTQPLTGADQSKLFFDEIDPSFNINGPGSFDNFTMDSGILYVTHQFNRNLMVRAISAYFNTGQEFLRRQGFTERPNQPGVLATFGLNRFFGLDRKWHRVDALWDKESDLGDVKLLLGVQYRDDVDRSTNFQDTTEPPFPLFSYTADNFNYKPLSSYRWVQGQDSFTRDILWNGMLSYTLPNDRLIIYGNYAKTSSAKIRAVNFFAGQTNSDVPWKEVEDPDDYGVGASFKVTPQVSLYGMFGGDSRLNGRNDAGVQLPNITQNIAEGGVKLSFGSRLNGSLAVFDIARENLAQRDFSQPSQPLLPSGGEASRGVEMEWYYTPTDSLSLIFSYTYMDAKRTSNTERPELVGTPIESGAKNSGSTWIRYRFREGPLERLTVGIGAIYSGETHPQASSAALSRYKATAPEYLLINAMARYTFHVGNAREVSTQLNLNNVTDEKYFAGYDYGAPFTADLTVSLRF